VATRFEFDAVYSHANADMLAKKTIGRLFGVCLATVFAPFVSGIVYWLSGGLRFGFLVAIFVALWIGFYFAGIWTAVDRPAELDRKIPINSKELRKNRNAFYDWLASQGRRD
jgi:hypothetical protein